jgi:glycosyltransferase involved in cell wall biosynthesis
VAVVSGGQIAVVIPARNEGPFVGDVVRGVRERLPAVLVVVVDDGSLDHTAAAARGAGAQVVRLTRSAGYAGALRAGYRVALGAGAEVVAQLDGDGQHDPGDLPDLLVALQGHDLVLGSRFLGGRSYRVPPGRRVGMAACRWMARRVGGLPVTDPTSGYRALRRPLAERLAAEGFPGGLTETSLLIQLHRQGIRVREVPVRMLPPSGRSMHRGLAGGAHFLRISWACLALAARRDGRPTALSEAAQPVD